MRITAYIGLATPLPKVGGDDPAGHRMLMDLGTDGPLGWDPFPDHGRNRRLAAETAQVGNRGTSVDFRQCIDPQFISEFAPMSASMQSAANLGGLAVFYESHCDQRAVRLLKTIQMPSNSDLLIYCEIRSGLRVSSPAILS